MAHADAHMLYDSQSELMPSPHHEYHGRPSQANYWSAPDGTCLNIARPTNLARLALQDLLLLILLMELRNPRLNHRIEHLACRA